jgi:prepilin-type N-terminal cleavage/methylation domain-containing protein
MSGRSSKTLANLQSTIRTPQLPRGFTLLDLLITLLVLALILLAAVKQFGSYQRPAPQPTLPAESAPAK